MGRIILGVLILAAVGSLMSCVTQVRSDERAVVRRFGRILPEKARPGLLFGLPWGLDRVNRVSLKDRTDHRRLDGSGDRREQRFAAAGPALDRRSQPGQRPGRD